MANQKTHVDYDKKFEEDLEKATALSLETLALDQFRRSKLQYSHSDVSSTTNKWAATYRHIQEQQQQFYAERSRPGSFRSESGRQSDPQIPIVPPPNIPSRRHSEVHFTEKSFHQFDVIDCSKNINENDNKNGIGSGGGGGNDDLISFTSPTSSNKEKNLNFEDILEEIQKLNSQSHNNVMYGSSPSLSSTDTSSSSSQGLQLVPYTQQQQQQQGQKTLTSEQLNKLYNMPHIPQLPFRQPYHLPHHNYVPGIQPTMTYNYTTIPPAPAYGFQMHIFPQNPTAIVNASANQLKFPSPPPPGINLPNAGTFNTMNKALIQTVPQQQQSQPPLLAVSHNANQLTQIPKSASITGNISVLSSSGSSNSDVIRRQKKLIATTTISTGNDDLIDWGQEDNNSRVSVLEAFDPLLCKDDDSGGDNSSDCTTSYYAEYDPFDYLYSCGTQYSDPVYEAVNKTDRTPLSPNGTPIGWNLSALATTSSSVAIQFQKQHQQQQQLQHDQQPPPLPPRNQYNILNLENNQNLSSSPSSTATLSSNQVLDRRKFTSRLYENVIDRKTQDCELMEFYKMVKELRSNYKYDDELTNVGHIVASEIINNQYFDDKSIKILVYPSLEALREKHLLNKNEIQIPGYGSPVIFTCDISTTVEHVIMHVYCALEGQIIGSPTDFALKPIGVMEWLSSSSKLCQLECVHDSIKLERDIQLGLCPKTEINMKAFSRTSQDDAREVDLKPEDILPNEHESTITFDNMMILIETLETEIDKLEMCAADSNPHSILSCSGVIQGVKAICALLGSIDTLEISNCVDELRKICASGQTVYSCYNTGHNPSIISETGDYAEISLRPKTMLDQIKMKCNQIREAIQELIETYANAFRVDFCVKAVEYTTTPISILYVLKPIIVNINCLHRPPPNWKYDDYMLGAQIYHGTRFIGDPIVIQCSNETKGGLFPRLKFDTWITFDKSPHICSLPRESRLIFVLYGCTIEPAEGGQSTTGNTGTGTGVTSGNGNNDQSNDNNGERKQINTELGWGAIQLFDFQREMICGSYLLSLWPPTTDKFLGPAPAKGCHPHPDFCPVLSIEIPNYGGRIVFPEPIQNPPVIPPRYDFNSLDHNLQEELLDTAEQGYIMSLDTREVFWEKRHYLQSFPHALPKVLHAAHSWDCSSLQDLHSLLKSWNPLTPLQALELLLPRYPDIEVRSKAVEWISKMPNDQLVDYLPQLLQALKHDTYEASPMARFLLSKCLESPRIAHHLYWLLVHSLPGDAPQNSIDASNGGGLSITSGTSEYNETLITQARYHRRNQMMLRSLLAICGEKLLSRFLSQNMMCKNLAEAANAVKQAKESLRQTTLIQGMEAVNQVLLETPTSLPLGPGYEVCGVNTRGCSYFNSYTLPLKIAFLGPDRGILPAIFKCGDDLQQDMLTIQLVRIMDKLWLAEGLDLKMVTFKCVPTGHKKGMIELVSDAETLRKIQVEYGLTGSFKDRPIAEWLAKKNPSQLEYQRAVDNFTLSCAGYSVATYILGVCDRHNDNIMLKTSGHLFHIDFGKFLGDAQMFGNFKRDRTPFVLTSDMAYVINGGDKPSTKFHHFVDLCCRAFNIVRNHGDLILHMLALMATAGIPGVTAEAVTYVRKALLPSQSNPEAAASFAKMIQFSLKSWFTQFNFFLHNLAQLRFSNDDGNGELLSFVPRTYTMQQDGRLKSVTVHGYQKRYDLEKYYTYILKVTRQAQPDPAYLFRSYKEFQEFHQKLCLHYPLAKLHSLPSGSGLGRSNVKTVAERRLPEIRRFLISLFDSADEIAHSDLVYTFFHPLLRDQEEADIHVSKVKEIKPKHKTENVCGEIKLSLQYRRGTLTVMVHHARGLPLLTGGQEPNTYVKCYLKPDTMKATKRKTKVVRKTCVPSFMETLEYRMPLEYIQNRILQVTVWSHDTLQENELLGGFELQLSQYDLREELCQWFRLGYLPRS